MSLSCHTKNIRDVSIANSLHLAQRGFRSFLASPKPNPKWTRQFILSSKAACSPQTKPKCLSTTFKNAGFKQISANYRSLATYVDSEQGDVVFLGGQEPSKPTPEPFKSVKDQSTCAKEIVELENVSVAEDQIVRELPDPSSPDTRKDIFAFQFSPPQTRRMLRKIEGKRMTRERKANWNSLLKSKGTWSYDWRIPLLELKMSHQAQDSKQLSNPEKYHYYLLGRPTDYSQTPASEIPRPAVWSKGRFAAHIDALSMAKVPRVLQRFIYMKNEPSTFRSSDAHVFKVRDALLALFEDRTLRSYFSSSAFDIALVFFYRHNMIRSSRKLFNIMVEQKIPIFPKTFNIMLWGAAKRRDLHNFTFLLRLMLSRNILPSDNTWLAFLAVVDSEVVKLTIMRTMNELGLLKAQRTMQMAIVQLISMEVKAHAQTKEPFQALINRLDSKYGKGWLSLQAGNKICECLGEVGLISQIPGMLSHMNANGFTPNKITLRIILSHCMRAQNSVMALYAIKQFNSLYCIKPTEIEYGYLFMLGWSAKSYNACRVLWRFACVEAAVPYRMEELVFKSLIRNTPEKPKNANQRWMKHASKIIVGVSFNNPMNLAQGGSALRIMRALTRWSPPGIARTEALSLAKEVLSSDLASSLTFCINSDFISIYEQALNLDQKWDCHGGKIENDMSWKLDHALHVKFQPKIRKIWAKDPTSMGSAASETIEAPNKARNNIVTLSPNLLPQQCSGSESSLS